MAKIYSDGDEESLDSGAFAAILRLRGAVGSDDASCRYPLGDPSSKTFMFCDGVADASSAYCRFHHALCVQLKG